MPCELTTSGTIRGIRGNDLIYIQDGDLLTLTSQHPVDLQTNKAQNISIKEKDNGYIVNVGCKEFVFESSTNLLKYLRMYLNNPNKTEKKFNEKKLFT